MIKELAFAKINLQLNILGRRPDGYHEVDMHMQTLSFADEVILEEGNYEGVEVLTTLPELNNPQNLASRAAYLLADYAGIKPKIKIEVKKNIFMEAGLAGGSSDAAAVLRGLNRMWQLGYSYETLENLGAGLGSDIPFMIQGGTARAFGRGEKLEHRPDAALKHVVLAKPRSFGISTKWAYGEFDKLPYKPGVEGENVLERVAFSKYPLLGELKQVALKAGAEQAMMSGSGPTMYALAGMRLGAERVAAVWRKYPVDIQITEFAGRIK